MQAPASDPKLTIFCLKTNFHREPQVPSAREPIPLNGNIHVVPKDFWTGGQLYIWVPLCSLEFFILVEFPGS